MKKIIFIVSATILTLFASCNKETIETNTNTQNNQKEVNTLSGAYYFDAHWTGACYGKGSNCVIYPEVVVKPKFTEVMTPVEVVAFFTTGAGAGLMSTLDATMQSKLTSGNYSMALNYEDAQIVNYRFTYLNDFFVLQFTK